MAHILESINENSPNPTFSSKEILEEQVTNLMARMWDVKSLIKEEYGSFSEIIEGWRTELVFIRNAVRDLKTDGTN